MPSAPTGIGVEPVVSTPIPTTDSDLNPGTVLAANASASRIVTSAPLR
jgi:hypothetical protein